MIRRHLPLQCGESASVLSNGGLEYLPDNGTFDLPDFVAAAVEDRISQSIEYVKAEQGSWVINV